MKLLDEQLKQSLHGNFEEGWKNINKDHKILNSNTQWSNNI